MNVKIHGGWLCTFLMSGTLLYMADRWADRTNGLSLWLCALAGGGLLLATSMFLDHEKKS